MATTQQTASQPTAEATARSNAAVKTTANITNITTRENNNHWKNGFLKPNACKKAKKQLRHTCSTTPANAADAFVAVSAYRAATAYASEYEMQFRLQSNTTIINNKTYKRKIIYSSNAN